MAIHVDSRQQPQTQAGYPHGYFAHGGNELVIGGKLTFLPGAEVDGADTLPAAFADEEIVQIPNQKESEATTVAALREDFNELLSKLKAAGLMAPDTAE